MKLLDGAAVARRIKEKVRAEAEGLASKGVRPFLRVILVGENPASMSYVSSKTKSAEEAGMGAETVRLPQTAPPGELLAEVARANADPAVHGILVQLPLPKSHDAVKVLDSIDPKKDVDGFHPE